jgi:P pilus assembly chaperone PapD
MKNNERKVRNLSKLQTQRKTSGRNKINYLNVINATDIHVHFTQNKM